MTVERGIDPRGFALMAFGGAGPLHAARWRGELGIRACSARAPPACSARSASPPPRRAATSRARSCCAASSSPPQRLRERARVAARRRRAPRSPAAAPRAAACATSCATPASPSSSPSSRATPPIPAGCAPPSPPRTSSATATARTTPRSSSSTIRVSALGRRRPSSRRALERRATTAAATAAAAACSISGGRLAGPAVHRARRRDALRPRGWSGVVDEHGTIVLDGRVVSAGRAMSALDPIELQVLTGALRAACEEMGVALIRSAHSSNIKERRDASTALFDADGEMIMQAEHIPVHLGAMPAAVAAVRDERHAPGVSWILNDPFAGGTHLPDITVVTPGLRRRRRRRRPRTRRRAADRLRREPRAPRRRRRARARLDARRQPQARRGGRRDLAAPTRRAPRSTSSSR